MYPKIGYHMPPVVIKDRQKQRDFTDYVQSFESSLGNVLFE